MKSKLELQTFTILGPGPTLDRRGLLQGMGSALLVGPLMPLFGCDSDSVANDNAGRGGGDRRRTPPARPRCSSAPEDRIG